MPSTAETRRAAADTLHHLARQVELGKVQVMAIESSLPLVRVPGAVMAPEETEPGIPLTFTMKYIVTGGTR